MRSKEVVVEEMGRWEAGNWDDAWCLASAGKMWVAETKAARKQWVEKSNVD